MLVTDFNVWQFKKDINSCLIVFPVCTWLLCMGIVMPGAQLNYSYIYWENRIRDKNYKVTINDAPDLYFPNSARAR